jgi:hypothetical protein
MGRSASRRSADSSRSGVRTGRGRSPEVGPEGGGPLRPYGAGDTPRTTCAATCHEIVTSLAAGMFS